MITITVCRDNKIVSKRKGKGSTRLALAAIHKLQGITRIWSHAHGTVVETESYTFQIEEA